MTNLPQVKIINGSAFIMYRGALYTEELFAIIHEQLYKAFFVNPTKKEVQYA